ncbi:MAG: PAS domain-containing sensor histidine kinase, partial [Spirochaetales bacterium]|nr:PAS domain-containing sensor histidine kinase [Spirochaetales bacterium]
PNDAREFLHIIQKQSNRLNAIIEYRLKLSRIEQGKQDIELRCASLQPIIESVGVVCGFKATDLGLTLECQCPEDIWVEVNPALLELALVNLVDNG